MTSEPWAKASGSWLPVLRRVTGKPADAIGPLSKALELDPGLTGARRALAEAFQKTGKLDEAIGQYRVLAERQPGDEAVTGSLVGLLIRKGSLEEAAGLLDRLEATRPVIAEELYNQAVLAGKLELALKVADREAELAGGDYQQRAWLGRQVGLLSVMDRHREAVKLSGEAHEKDKSDGLRADIHLRALLAAREFDRALALVGQQVQQQQRPDVKLEWQKKGVRALLLADRFDEAIALAEKLYAADKDDEELALLYLRSLMLARRHAPAINLAAEQAELSQDDADRRLRWQGLQVELLGEAKRHDHAVRLAEQIYTSDPDAEQPAMIYLRALLSAERYDPALELVADQLKRHADGEPNAAWQVRRITVLEMAGRRDQALQAAKSHHEAAPKDPVRVQLYAELLLSVRNYKDALGVLDGADKAAVRLEQLPLLRMRALVGLDRMNDAADVLQRWLASTDADRKADVWYSAASVYSLAHKSTECTRALEEALKLAPAHTSANNDLGYQLADQGVRLDRAEKMVTVALLRNPDEPAYIDSMAWVLYKKGNFEQARKLLAEVLVRETDLDPVILDHYGDVLYRLGERDKALEQWKASAGARRKRADRPEGIESSTLERTLKKIEAVEKDLSDVPVAPLGEGVTPPGAQRI